MELGGIQLADSRYTPPDVNTTQDEYRQEPGKPQRDGYARWDVKGKQRARRRGNENPALDLPWLQVPTATNAESQTITGLVVAEGEAHDVVVEAATRSEVLGVDEDA